MMYIILLICFVNIVTCEESGETKYIDLLPDKEKDDFLETIARRIFGKVNNKDVAEAVENTKFIKGLEDKMNLKKGDSYNDEAGVSGRNDKKHESHDNADQDTDLTKTEGKRPKRNSNKEEVDDSKIVHIEPVSDNKIIKLSANELSHEAGSSDTEDIQIKYMKSKITKIDNIETSTQNDLQVSRTQIHDTEENKPALNNDASNGTSNEKNRKPSLTSLKADTTPNYFSKTEDTEISKPSELPYLQETYKPFVGPQTTEKESNSSEIDVIISPFAINLTSVSTTTIFDVVSTGISDTTTPKPDLKTNNNNLLLTRRSFEINVPLDDENIENATKVVTKNYDQTVNIDEDNGNTSMNMDNNKNSDGTSLFTNYDGTNIETNKFYESKTKKENKTSNNNAQTIKPSVENLLSGNNNINNVIRDVLKNDTAAATIDENMSYEMKNSSQKKFEEAILSSTKLKDEANKHIEKTKKHANKKNTITGKKAIKDTVIETKISREAIVHNIEDAILNSTELIEEAKTDIETTTTTSTDATEDTVQKTKTSSEAVVDNTEKIGTKHSGQGIISVPEVIYHSKETDSSSSEENIQKSDEAILKSNKVIRGVTREENTLENITNPTIVTHFTETSTINSADYINGIVKETSSIESNKETTVESNIESTTLQTEVIPLSALKNIYENKEEAIETKEESLPFELNNDTSHIVNTDIKIVNISNTEKKLSEIDKTSLSIVNNMMKMIKTAIINQSYDERMDSLEASSRDPLPMEYEVYEVRNKPHIYDDAKLNKENPYYVPIYNYSPENAHYNPQNSLTPNADENISLKKYTSNANKKLKRMGKPPNEDDYDFRVDASDEEAFLKEKDYIDKVAFNEEQDYVDKKSYSDVNNINYRNKNLRNIDIDEQKFTREGINNKNTAKHGENSKDHLSLVDEMMKMIRTAIINQSNDEKLNGLELVNKHPQPKEYKVNEVEKKPPIHDVAKLNKENPYYVPVYNYHPRNAHYNPQNRIGPNSDDNDDIIFKQFASDADKKAKRMRQPSDGVEYDVSSDARDEEALLKEIDYTDRVAFNEEQDYIDKESHNGIYKNEYLRDMKIDEHTFIRGILYENKAKHENPKNKYSHRKAKLNEDNYVQRPYVDHRGEKNSINLFESSEFNDKSAYKDHRGSKSQLQQIRDMMYNAANFGYQPPKEVEDPNFTRLDLEDFKKKIPKMCLEDDNDCFEPHAVIAKEHIYNKKNSNSARHALNNMASDNFFQSMNVDDNEKPNILNQILVNGIKQNIDVDTVLLEIIKIISFLSSYQHPKAKNMHSNLMIDRSYQIFGNRNEKSDTPKSALRQKKIDKKSNVRDNKTSNITNDKISNLTNIKEIIQIIPDDVELLLTITEMNLKSHLRTDKDIDLEPYVSVLDDMIQDEAKTLVQYDWLRTTIDIQAAILKLMNMTKSLKTNKLPNRDFQLLKYTTFLHKLAFRSQNQLRSFLPPTLKHKWVLKKPGLLSRDWFVNEPGLISKHLRGIKQTSVTYLDLFHFNELLKDLQDYLYDLHTTIKEIASITPYNNQRWFTTIKDVYLDTNKKGVLTLLLHITVARLVDLVEKSAQEALEKDILEHVTNNVKAIQRSRDEVILILKIIEELKLNDLEGNDITLN